MTMFNLARETGTAIFHLGPFPERSMTKMALPLFPMLGSGPIGLTMAIGEDMFGRTTMGSLSWRGSVPEIISSRQGPAIM